MQLLSLSRARLCIFILLSPGLAAAQGLIDGFTRGQGKTDLAFSVTWEWYDQFWVGDTKVDAPPDLGPISSVSYSVFIDHGLRDDLDLVASIPFVSRSGDGSAPPPDEDGFQDLAVFLKYRAWQSSPSAIGNGRISLLPAFGFQTPLSNYEGNTPVAIGHQDTDLDARFVLQYTANSGFFAALQSGYDFKIGDAPNALPFGIKVGRGGRKLYFAGWLAIQNSFGGTDIGAGPFPTNEIDFTRIGGDVYLQLRPQFGISFSGGATLGGRNVGQAGMFSAGLVYRLGQPSP